MHKSENPRCFKNINKSSLPVKYFSQRSAWMTGHLFSEWFEGEFVPHLLQRGLQPKASSYSFFRLTSGDKQIRAVFLPANTTALLQPMDQGVLEAMKQHYKKSLLRTLLMVDGDEGPTSKQSPSWSLIRGSLSKYANLVYYRDKTRLNHKSENADVRRGQC